MCWSYTYILLCELIRVQQHKKPEQNGPATICLKDEELTPFQPFAANLFYKVLQTEPLHDWGENICFYHPSIWTLATSPASEMLSV